jgi:hypothetical protein
MLDPLAGIPIGASCVDVRERLPPERSGVGADAPAECAVSVPEPVTRLNCPVALVTVELPIST